MKGKRERRAAMAGTTRAWSHVTTDDTELHGFHRYTTIAVCGAYELFRDDDVPASAGDCVVGVQLHGRPFTY
jgi:hypothetical protein